MFTGIIEEVGAIQSVGRGPERRTLTILAPATGAELSEGDSVNVSGVCLTVSAKQGNSFTVDLAPETLGHSNLDELKPGAAVNLERALKMSDRLGGHLVAGHVDVVGTVTDRKREGNAIILKVRVAPSVTRYLVERGSVAVDGISLTVVETGRDAFAVSVIPHTAKVTTLGFKGPGDTVNVEVDMIAKYVEKFVAGGSREDLTIDKLRKHGFA